MNLNICFINEVLSVLLFCFTSYACVGQMEEEAERLRQPPVKPEPEEEREHKPSREERDRGRERDRERERRKSHVPSDDDVEEGEELEDEEEVKPCLKPTMRPIVAAPSVSSASGNATPNTPGEESPCGIIIPHENSPPEIPLQEENRPKIGLSLKLGEFEMRGFNQDVMANNTTELSYTFFCFIRFIQLIALESN